MRDWIVPEHERVPSPNRYRGRNGHETDLLIIHYAVDPIQISKDDAADVARGFSKPKRNRSAHLVIGRDASRRQCVALSDGAWHAGDRGKSRFPPDGVARLEDVPARRRVVNYRSVGIELCNVGWAVDRFKVPADRRARAKHPANRREQTWETFPDVQIEALDDLVRELVQEIPTLRWICGHEDVTNRDTLERVGGKTDPGPLFPWDAIDWQGYGLVRVRYDLPLHAWVRETGRSACVRNGHGTAPKSVEIGP